MDLGVGDRRTARRLRTFAALFALIGALGLLAVSAEAAQLRYEKRFGADLIVDAAPGESNVVTVDGLGQVPAGAPVLLVGDRTSLVPADRLTRDHCLALGRLATCHSTHPVFQRIFVNLGDGADSVTITGIPSLITGGAGSDRIVGGENRDWFDGGPGADEFFGRGQPAGWTDEVDYSSHPGGVVVTVDDLADDGLPSESDNVHTDIEFVTGSPFADLLVAGPAGTIMRGGTGDDRLQGLAARDLLNGGPGTDSLAGGAGNDGLNARDGIGEQVDCGVGQDEASVDPADTVAANCETVFIR